MRGKIFTFALILGLLSFPLVAFGMMSSSNYTIYADSVDAGGVYSSSGTYSIEDTVGESPVGIATSSSYEVRGGYQGMDLSSLTMNLSQTNLDLGTASVSQVNSASTTATITTDAGSGYSLSVGSVSGTSLAAVTDGTVTAGQEEYGVAVSGPDALFGDDRGIAPGLNLAAASMPVTNSDTILTFKASISDSTASGSRSQDVILTASANF